MTLEHGIGYVKAHTSRTPFHGNLPDGTVVVMTRQGHERIARRRFTPGMGRFGFAWKTIATVDREVNYQFADTYRLPIMKARRAPVEAND